MFDTLAGIGILGFLIFIVLGLVALVKKSGKAKKRFGIAAGLFVLFMVGVLNSPTSETATTDVKSDEGEVKAAKEEDADQKEEKQPEKEPATLEEVKAAVTAGMSDKDFKKAKKELNVEQTKSISIGNGNVGYVLQATDGILVATTDGESIMEVLPFASMDEVDKYESEMVAKAEAEAKEKAKKDFEESKIKVSGNGDTASDGIELKSGWAIFDGSHTGGSNFIVQLQDENGNDLELLVNEIGSYKGKTFAQIPVDGTYYLNIKAGGPWEYTVYQSPPVKIADAPTTLEGTGDDVVFFNIKSGHYKFNFSHSGSSNFIVMLNGQGLMVNEIGAYEGSTRQQLKTDGYYALVIKADGGWSVGIEE
ncbi:hypothetical protein [Bacillus sp. Marseille-Q1617]|uniref:hypothetical protein n=1 Tax=Bacillus sp. Marseille-Q1617 TaxID=2736887 RepID=UPI00158BB8C2|nr:hypothetical protein [Bacillus sp. Marseille-Q1617]